MRSGWGESGRPKPLRRDGIEALLGVVLHRGDGLVLTVRNGPGRPVNAKKGKPPGLLRRSRVEPLFPGHEFHADQIIVDHQISLVITPNCAGFDFLHFLRHDPHIGG